MPVSAHDLDMAEQPMNSFARVNHDQPCEGISVNGKEPPVCEVHMLPWGHAPVADLYPAEASVDPEPDQCSGGIPSLSPPLERCSLPEGHEGPCQ